MPLLGAQAVPPATLPPPAEGARRPQPGGHGLLHLVRVPARLLQAEAPEAWGVGRLCDAPPRRDVTSGTSPKPLVCKNSAEAS